MASPLFHNSLPVALSSAYRTAFEERSAITLALLERNSPLESANTTPLTIAGGSGEIMSRDTQPRRSVVAPFSSTIWNATIPPFLISPAEPAGASTQRTPDGSCQLAIALVEKLALENGADCASGCPASPPESNNWIRPSLVATAIQSLPLCSNRTGVEVNFDLPLYELLTSSVPGSSATRSPLAVAA